MSQPANAYIVRISSTAAVIAAAGVFLFASSRAFAATARPAPDEPSEQRETAWWPIKDRGDAKETKREALGRIVAFTRSEAEQLLAKISRVDEKRPEFITLEARFTDSLNRALSYLEAAADELALPQLTLSEIEKKAAEFGEWRTAYYDPAARGAIDLIVVSQNEHALATAGARFMKISETARRVGLLKTSDLLDALLKKASHELRAGRELHGKALDALRRIYPPPEKKTGAETLFTDEELDRPGDPPGTDPIPALIQESLAHTRVAYDAFIKIGRLLTARQSLSN